MVSPYRESCRAQRWSISHCNFPERSQLERSAAVLRRIVRRMVTIRKNFWRLRFIDYDRDNKMHCYNRQVPLNDSFAAAFAWFRSCRYCRKFMKNGKLQCLWTKLSSIFGIDQYRNALFPLAQWLAGTMSGHQSKPGFRFEASNDLEVIILLSICD